MLSKFQLIKLTKKSLILSKNVKNFHCLSSSQSKYYLVKKNETEDIKLKFSYIKRFNSTETVKTISSVTKEAIDTIKKTDENVIDLSDFKIPDLPTADQILELKTHLTALDLGLTSWLPPGILYKLFDNLHSLNIDWWLSVVISTLICRTLIFPLIVSSKKALVEKAETTKIMKQFQEDINKAQLSGNQMLLANVTRKYQSLINFEDIKNYEKSSKIAPFKLPLAQAVIFTSFFITLRKMAYYPIPSLHDSSFLWCPSLAETDPYYLLPIITSTSLFFTLRLGTDTGVSIDSMGKLQKSLIYGVPIMSLAITSNFPAILCLYWCTSNLHGLLFNYLLTKQKVRKYFNIKDVKKQEVLESEKNMSSFLKIKKTASEMKSMYKNMKVQSNIRNMEQTDESTFDKSGTGPLKKTFKYDPTKK